VDEDVGRYIVNIVRATREEKRLSLGVSPRGGIALYRMAQAHAYLNGRGAVTPDDVKKTAVEVLAHRVALETKARYSGVTRDNVIKEILEKIRVPV
ncbi:MAG TPA: magnesium chelatase, partial [Planctomycetota bacterium]|nr:magnesium chelatase [Planctomycetota bacterium]